MNAFGSGGSFTARATAKIGELMLQKGHWEGKALFSEDAYNSVLARQLLNKPNQLVSDHHGWILNIARKWPSLPPDAYCGVGGGHQIVLVIPSLDLVMVRNGEKIKVPGKTFFGVLDQELFKPLIQAIVGCSSRQIASDRY